MFGLSFGVEDLRFANVSEVVGIVDFNKELLELKVSVLLVLRLGGHFARLELFRTGSWSALDCSFVRGLGHLLFELAPQSGS